MVLSMATGLLGLGLAMPTGLAFGFGYGYGVRQGYHAYSPSKSKSIQQGYADPNPLVGAQAQGLHSANEMHMDRIGKKANPPMTSPPTPSIQKAGLSASAGKEKDTRYYQKKGGTLHWSKDEIYAKGAKHGLTDKREMFRKYVNAEYPYLPTYRTKQRLKGRR